MKEMETLSVMILDDVEELMRKINTLKNTKENITTDNETVQKMMTQVRFLRDNVIINIDEIRELRRKK